MSICSQSITFRTSTIAEKVVIRSGHLVKANLSQKQEVDKTLIFVNEINGFVQYSSESESAARDLL